MRSFRHRPDTGAEWRGIGLFSDCTAAELRALDHNSVAVERPAGTYLFRETDIQREVVAIVHGSAVVSVDGVPAGVLRSGDCAGSPGRVGRQRWPASGITSESSLVLVLAANEIAALVADVPRLADRLFPSIWPSPGISELVGVSGGPALVTTS